MAHIFVSYLHDDEEEIDHLVTALQKEQLEIWLDVDQLRGGDYWEPKIQTAIAKAEYFLACFSDNYAKRKNTYMEKEVLFAIDQCASKPPNWLIPIRLNPCVVPNFGLPGGGTINEIQWIDLFPDWWESVRKLVNVARPASPHDRGTDVIYREFCSRHIESKIARDRTLGALRSKDLESAWRNLLIPRIWDPTLDVLLGLFKKVKNRGLPLTEFYDEPGDAGITIAVTLSPTENPDIILKSLNGNGSHDLSPLARIRQVFSQRDSRLNPYYYFLQQSRRRIRSKTNWQKRDFAHWIFTADLESITVDLLYWINIETQLFLIGYMLEENKTMLQSMYPGSLITAHEMEAIGDAILKEEVRLFRED